MTRTALDKHRLEVIKYCRYGSYLAKLTFCFSGSVYSPPKGTYLNGEPELEIPVPSITSVIFNTAHDGQNFSLNHMLLFRHETLVGSLACTTVKPVHESQTLSL